MKKVIIFALMPFIMVFCKSKTDNGTVIEKWDNGNPKITKEFTEKSNNSYIYAEYFKDGNIKSKEIYKKGKLDGSCKYFDDEGFLNLEKQYNNGILISEYTYKYGKLDGPEKIYHYNGQLWTERIINNGRPWEVVSNFDSTGKPMDMGTLKDGYGTLKLYDKKGNLLEIKTYKEGMEVIK